MSGSEKNKSSGNIDTAIFHTQIRWSHGKFQNNPEAKLYKNFAWENVDFFESIYGNESINRFRIIGEGSYATVYEALHRPSAEKVAVKAFKIDISTTTEERKRFEREVKIMSRLKHPNILPVIDYDLSSRNSNWYAMPLAITSIAEIVDELKQNLPRVNNIYCQILMGMAYAHQQNIIHRDLKPQNIMLFSGDRIMIGDFGFGKHVGADTSHIALTNSDDQLGTFAYCAPEQYISAASVDHRADIYSLGKTLLHMAIGGEPPMYPNQIIHKADRRYVSFIEHCIQDDPGQRFQSVEEMLDQFSIIATEMRGD